MLISGYIDSIRRYLRFGGCSTRSQVASFLAVFFTGTMVAVWLDRWLDIEVAPGRVFIAATLAWTLVHLIPFLSVMARRLRDCGLPPVLLLLALVPWLNVAFFLGLISVPSGTFRRG